MDHFLESGLYERLARAHRLGRPGLEFGRALGHNPGMTSPPLLLLTDIRVTLGTVPLLDGAGLGVGAGERICLVGRNGSGKSTLLKIASGEIAFDGGTRFLQPGTTMRYLPQEPDLSAFANTMDYVVAGLGPNDEEYRARYLLEQLGLTGAGKAGKPLRRRGAAGRSGAHFGAESGSAAARRADQPSGSAGHRMAGIGAEIPVRRHRADQP